MHCGKGTLIQWEYGIPSGNGCSRQWQAERLGPVPARAEAPDAKAPEREAASAGPAGMGSEARITFEKFPSDKIRTRILQRTPGGLSHYPFGGPCRKVHKRCRGHQKR